MIQGYAIDEITPSFDAWLARVHPDDRHETVVRIEEARDARTVYAHVFRTSHPDGTIRWCSARGRFFYDDQGEPRRMIGVMEDITDRKTIEDALRLREADLARVQRIGRVGGLDIDVANGLRSRRSPEYLRLHGLPQDGREESHEHWRERVHPEDRKQAERALFAALEGDGLNYESEYRIIRENDGEIRWIHARADIERDDEGRALRLVGAHLDITEQRQMQDAIRASEERFQQFGRASSDGLWIRDAASLALEYASDAMETIYGISREKMMADPLAWPALIVPEDRATTFAYIQRVKAGEAAVHEYRIQRPCDLQFRWIRSVGFPLFENGEGITRIAGISSDVSEEKQLAEHQAVLLAELQHRVRNIMAIIRSIVARTAGGAETTAEYVELLAGRLLTLARVQALLTKEANAGAGMIAIVHDELAAQAARSEQFDIAGADVVLAPKAAETITLAVHELTTNALKYGALSHPEGKVAVRWDIVEKRGVPWLSFDWTETGAPRRDPAAGPRRIGFGSELIEGRVPYELGGRGSLTIEPGGARCHLEFPLEDGASILETDAPQRATVFGGAIDMTGHADLTGQRVLVMEDDYYLATDTARALQGAGAEVIGPYASEAAARDELGEHALTCAVLYINLDNGPSFDLARELKHAQVPIVFVTGYDQTAIPEDLTDVVRLQKPVQFRQIVRALADALGIR